MMICQDRSLGSVELHVSSLAKESGGGQYRYESTGVKEVSEPIHLDKGNVYKGYLQYTATFIPALAVKGIKFESKKNEIATRNGRGDDASDNASTYSSSDDEGHGLPSGVTIKLAAKDTPNDTPNDTPKDASKDAPQGHVATNSTDSSHSLVASDEALTPDTSAPEEGVEMSTDELLAHRTSGVRFMLVKC
jgi:hypothetical protein